MWTHFRRLFTNRSGSVGIQMGLFAVPVIGLAGAALDYSLAASDRSRITAALDAGAIAGARLLGTRPDPEVRADIERIVRTNLAGRDDVTFNIDISRTAQTVQLSAAATRETTLLRVLGINTIDVGSRVSAFAPARRKIEVALALDNTGSMAGQGKMDALKAASQQFITSMQNASRDPGDIRVAVVPFDRYVRVGTAYSDANWLRDVRHNWNGCVEDRDSPHNTRDTVPTNDVTRFPAVTCGTNSLTTMRPLTNDWQALRSTIDAMRPSGNTNITIGLAWGWHLLSPRVPFTETIVTSTPDVERWLILLTDGDNTQDRFGFNNSQIDDRTRQTCANVKADGIRVMTVRVIAGNRTLLRDCASDPSYYYEVSNANDLIAVFERMASSITALTLTR